MLFYRKIDQMFSMKSMCLSWSLDMTTTDFLMGSNFENRDYKERVLCSQGKTCSFHF